MLRNLNLIKCKVEVKKNTVKALSSWNWQWSYINLRFIRNEQNNQIQAVRIYVDLKVTKNYSYKKSYKSSIPKPIG